MSSARRFRIADWLRVRLRESPAPRQRSSAQRSLAHLKGDTHTHTHSNPRVWCAKIRSKLYMRIGGVNAHARLRSHICPTYSGPTTRERS